MRIQGIGWICGALFTAALTAPAPAGGTLKPLGSPERPIQILDHHVDIVVNNGFARTEVTQSFFNPNNTDLEAIYSFPVPRSASLSEFTISIGEREINGEVLPKAEAQAAYQEEKDQGHDAGLAEKNSFYTFDFRVSPVRANDETRIRFVYYQPIEIDTGMGRYVYPLQEGGTDDAALRFWTTNDVVEGTFSVDLELKSAWPVTGVRTPGFEADAAVDQLDEGHWTLKIERQGARLNRDFVFYYRLAEDLPGRVELLTYRPDPGEPGTFMMILTPGLDLKPITGADYVFVLDVSGSMDGDKIRTLARGVSQAVGELNPDDRFRIVCFNNSASELTRGWIAATTENAQGAIRRVEGLQAGGSTNLYEGLKLALKRLDDDRVTSIVLITDAVTNTGVVDAAAFHKLMKQYDIRVFGFLVGNSANWPLMRTVCEASGGFFAQISTSDDLIGQILLAKSKISHESLHDAELKIRGVDVFATTGQTIGKVYRGQQLVVFGRYEKPGEAAVALKAALSGADKTYQTTFAFPEIDELHPELERLWALERIDDIQWRMDAGLMSPGEGEQTIVGLGVDYQIVTDHTSMVVMSDTAFDQRGIDRRNQRRVAVERQAQARRAAQPITSSRVDQNHPMFQHQAPSAGGDAGGGPAIDPVSGALAIGLGALAFGAARRRRKQGEAS